jgi:hypothetical protein
VGQLIGCIHANDLLCGYSFAGAFVVGSAGSAADAGIGR